VIEFDADRLSSSTLVSFKDSALTSIRIVLAEFVVKPRASMRPMPLAVSIPFSDDNLPKVCINLSHLLQ